MLFAAQCLRHTAEDPSVLSPGGRGLARQVTNKAPNLKMAWDLMRPDSLVEYVEVQALVQRFGLYMHFGDDYTSLQSVLQEIVRT
jgi:hypothetical protein